VDGATRPLGEGTGHDPLRAVVVVSNPLGLHMRAAMKFAEEARRFRSAVVVRYDTKNKLANGKSVMDMMLLGAFPGDELTVEVDGDDASAALDVLAKVLGAPSADDVPEGGRPAPPA
jgi:phosphocarrier protein